MGRTYKITRFRLEGASAKCGKEKLAIAFATVSLLIGTLLIVMVQFDSIPKYLQFPVNPPLNNTSINTGINRGNNSTGCHTEEGEVDWFPSRYWTHQSKYSPVVKAPASPPGLQMYGTPAAQRAIWLHQHPTTCHDKKFLIFEALANAHGIGSVIHLTGVMLHAVLNLNRILVLKPQPDYVWVQGKFCDGTDTLDECYFEPLYSCTMMDAFGSETEVSTENFFKFPEIDKTTYATNNDRVLRGTVRHPNNVPSSYERHAVDVPPHAGTRQPFHGILLLVAYTVRPTLRTLRELERRHQFHRD